MGIRAVVFVALSGLLVAGCMPAPVKAPAVYTISVAGSPAGQVAGHHRRGISACNHVLKIMPVRGDAPFTGTGILYRDSPHGLETYAFSRWSDAPVQMVETYLVNALEDSNLFRAVLPSWSESGSDVLLETVVTDFSLHMDDGSRLSAVIAMRFFLVDKESGKLLATEEFVSRRPARCPEARCAVDALNSALHSLVHEVVLWLGSQDIFSRDSTAFLKALEVSESGNACM